MAYEDLRLPEQIDGHLGRYRVRHIRGRRMHRHHELEFNLVLQGGGTYLVDGRRYDLARGTLIWLFPEQAHSLAHSGWLEQIQIDRLELGHEPNQVTRIQ